MEENQEDVFTDADVKRWREEVAKKRRELFNTEKDFKLTPKEKAFTPAHVVRQQEEVELNEFLEESFDEGFLCQQRTKKILDAAIKRGVTNPADLAAELQKRT